MRYCLGKTCAFYWELVGFVGLLKAYHRIYGYNKYRERLLRTGDFSGCIIWDMSVMWVSKWGYRRILIELWGLDVFRPTASPFVFPKMWTQTRLKQTFQKPIGSMYAIYGNIYHQYTPNVSIYTSTMHPMGRSQTEIPGCQQDYVVYLGISGSPSRSQLEVVPLARTQMTIPARGPRGPRRERFATDIYFLGWVDILIDTDTLW